MQWNNVPNIVPPAALDRWRLRRAALRYAAHGWPVTPGARLNGTRFDCGRPGCPIMSCHPAQESWQDDQGTDGARVASWWRHRAHTVLLSTGRAFDVIEVPGSIGRIAETAARGPVAVTPAGRWMFLVRPGLGLRAELDNRWDVVRHGRGSWVPAAPSRMPDGPVRWAVDPDEVGWRLPDPVTVQAVLVDALGVRPAERPVAVIPRQLSTARRAA
jgi:hypothetical protein